jgi:RHS repeat-associated protein
MPTLEKTYLTPCDTWELRYGPEDHLGSTRMVINGETASFTAQEQTFFYSYGNMHEFGVAPVNTREKFTGKEFDQDGGDGTTGTGIEAFHFGARMYDPETGVWLGADPAEQYWNRYSYVGGNPISLIDLTGMQSDSIETLPRMTVTATGYSDKSKDFWLQVQSDEQRDNLESDFKRIMSYQNRVFMGVMVNIAEMFILAPESPLAQAIGSIPPEAWEGADALMGGMMMMPATRIEGAFGREIIALAEEFGLASRELMAAKGALTNAQLVERAGAKAFRAVKGKGPVVGTARHEYATALLDRYQSIFGSRGLATKEVGFFNGKTAIADVLDKNNLILYDWKFGNAARMSTSQFTKYSGAFPQYIIDVLKYTY